MTDFAEFSALLESMTYDQTNEPAFFTDAFEKLNVICATRRQYRLDRVPLSEHTRLGHCILSAYHWSEEEAIRYPESPSPRTPPFGPMKPSPPYISIWIFDARNTNGNLPVVPRNTASTESWRPMAGDKALLIFNMGGPDALVAIPLHGLTTIPAGPKALQLVLTPILCDKKIEDFSLSVPDPFALRFITALYKSYGYWCRDGWQRM
ncbi:hypothetical protein LTS10_001130 [Elasticomyces elasticus]|nr:hypothetical protein LTS10_001130 [Elasticomyces elasticus]